MSETPLERGVREIFQAIGRAAIEAWQHIMDEFKKAQSEVGEDRWQLAPYESDLARQARELKARNEGLKLAINRLESGDREREREISEVQGMLRGDPWNPR